MKAFAIIVPAQPHPAPPANTSCAYQVEVAYHEYKCMTAQEYQEYKAPEPSPASLGLPTAFFIVYGVIAVAVISIFVVFEWRRNRLTKEAS